MNAKEIMTQDVITVAPTITVKRLADILIKNQVSGAPVAGKNGKIIGMVSEADLITKRGRDVRSIMSKNVLSVREDTSLEEIAQLMTTHNIKRMPVMRDDKLVGIVSRADLVSTIALGENLAIHTPVYDL
jgi:CBS domain-containing protein